MQSSSLWRIYIKIDSTKQFAHGFKYNSISRKAKQGDADAFSTLYQMYYPKMKGICINILREDKAVVDDLVKDAFILAFVSLKDLKNTHRFSKWLISITTNLVLKYQEKGKRYDFISAITLLIIELPQINS